ncbi:hypothetical protein MHB42_13575 [Lysinibacillus sp. FSL K6-0232]|uniref:hypothetical protein n=1 Tax=unclassified Lysinibacillus TaxID=2636778 RepID=UPI0030F90244
MKIWVAVLAMIGGLAGLASGFIVTAFGTGFGENDMANDGATVFWLSALAIFMGFISWKFHKIGGIMLILIAIYGFFTNGLFFIVAFIFLILAGILAFRIKQTPKADITNA